METVEPNPTWSADAYDDTVRTLADRRGTVTYKVWGADWCGDCRAVLPDFFAALDAADIPDEDITVYEVDQEKNGEETEAYDVSLIPTIVAERDGVELARFEESEPVSAAEFIADQLEDADPA